MMIETHTASVKEEEYALIGDGDIPGMKIGDAYRVPKINVIRYALSAGNPRPAA